MVCSASLFSNKTFVSARKTKKADFIEFKIMITDTYYYAASLVLQIRSQRVLVFHSHQLLHVLQSKAKE